MILVLIALGGAILVIDLVLELLTCVLTFRELVRILFTNSGLFDHAKFVAGTFFFGAIAGRFDLDSLLLGADASIFPSDALGGCPLTNFPFYLCL